MILDLEKEYEVEIEKYKKEMGDKIAQAQEYADSMGYINPGAVVLFRYTPPPVTKGGLIKAHEFVDKVGRSSLFGKILKISPLKATEEKTQYKKEQLKVGDWVMFLAANPIKGGLPEIHQCQLLASDDVLCSLSEEHFEKFIASKEI